MIHCKITGHQMVGMNPDEIARYFHEHGGETCFVKCARCDKPLPKPEGVPPLMFPALIVAGAAIGTLVALIIGVFA